MCAGLGSEERSSCNSSSNSSSGDSCLLLFLLFCSFDAIAAFDFAWTACLLNPPTLDTVRGPPAGHGIDLTREARCVCNRVVCVECERCAFVWGWGLIFWFARFLALLTLCFFVGSGVCVCVCVCGFCGGRQAKCSLCFENLMVVREALSERHMATGIVGSEIRRAEQDLQVLGQSSP